MIFCFVEINLLSNDSFHNFCLEANWKVFFYENHRLRRNSFASSWNKTNLKTFILVDHRDHNGPFANLFHETHLTTFFFVGDEPTRSSSKRRNFKCVDLKIQSVKADRALHTPMLIQRQIQIA